MRFDKVLLLIFCKNILVFLFRLFTILHSNIGGNNMVSVVGSGNPPGYGENGFVKEGVKKGFILGAEVTAISAAVATEVVLRVASFATACFIGGTAGLLIGLSTGVIAGTLETTKLKYNLEGSQKRIHPLNIIGHLNEFLHICEKKYLNIIKYAAKWTDCISGTGKGKVFVAGVNIVTHSGDFASCISQSNSLVERVKYLWSHKKTPIKKRIYEVYDRVINIMNSGAEAIIWFTKQVCWIDASTAIMDQAQAVADITLALIFVPLAIKAYAKLVNPDGKKSQEKTLEQPLVFDREKIKNPVPVRLMNLIDKACLAAVGVFASMPTVIKFVNKKLAEHSFKALPVLSMPGPVFTALCSIGLMAKIINLYLENRLDSLSPKVDKNVIAIEDAFDDNDSDSDSEVEVDLATAFVEVPVAV